MEAAVCRMTSRMCKSFYPPQGWTFWRGWREPRFALGLSAEGFYRVGTRKSGR
jgi:hypothetical protein